MSLVDTERQWFKSIQGLPVSETSRKTSFCAWTLLPACPTVLLVKDAREDERCALIFLLGSCRAPPAGQGSWELQFHKASAASTGTPQRGLLASPPHLPDGVRQLPPCACADALRELRRFADNPLVTGPPDIRFYAGAPLVTSSGLRLGSLCVIDCEPRDLDADQLNVLCNFAEVVVREIEKDAARVRAHSQPPAGEGAGLPGNPLVQGSAVRQLMR